MSIFIDEDIHKKAVDIANNVYKKNSAYKSGYIVKLYKEFGGRFKNDTEKPLKRWYLEKWKSINNIGYPTYRPTKRINYKTPLTIKEITKSNIIKQIKLKQKYKGNRNLPPFQSK